MKTLSLVTSSKTYPIHVGEGLLHDRELFRSFLPGRGKLVIVSNEIVAPLYLASFRQLLEEIGHEVVAVVLPDGEHHKNWQTLNLIFDALLEHGAERSTPLIALGGGVIGDMTGFAAAVYQRGVPFFQIPTTLLSQVDSSVGGKTAINHPMGKNMIGAFYQPEAVVIDISVLASLPERELSAGLAEVIKYGLIADLVFLEWLELNMEKLRAREPQVLMEAIRRSCESKACVVGQDERENGIRATLNLGHTFGHAIETALGYGVWLHGEAVGVGMLIAARVSCAMGWLATPDVERVERIIARAGLPLETPVLGFERWMNLMGHDKKVSAGRIRFVLLRALGEACITSEVPEAVLRQHLP